MLVTNGFDAYLKHTFQFVFSTYMYNICLSTIILNVISLQINDKYFTEFIL